jgi:hypothetical protein
MVMLLAAYPLDRSRPMSSTYCRPEDRLATSDTPAWIPGRRYGVTKPVYLPTSPKTLPNTSQTTCSAGRAVVVGEPTGGNAHPFGYRRLHQHLVSCLAESRSIGPITTGNWARHRGHRGHRGTDGPGAGRGMGSHQAKLIDA